MEDLDSVADFVTVYITEAHAQDEWPIGSRHRYNQPTTLAERAAVATKFVEEYAYRGRLLLDPIGPDAAAALAALVETISDNPFEREYAAWPLRLHVLHAGRLAMVGSPVDASYLLSSVRAAVAAALSGQ